MSREVVVTPQAEHLDLDAIQLRKHPENGTRTFADGEVYVQLEELADLDEAVVVHSGAPGPNRGLSYLYGILDLLKKRNIDTEVFFTYFPYGMQDEEFFPGALNYSRSILDKLVDYYKVEQINVVEPHFAERPWTDEYKLNTISGTELLLEDLDDSFTIVGPDGGALERFGIESYRKNREGQRNIELEGELDLEGNVLVLDDIVETGGTMAAAYERIKDEGADRVEAAAVHGVLKEGVEKIASTYDGFRLTNSVKNDRSNTRIEPLVKKAV